MGKIIFATRNLRIGRVALLAVAVLLLGLAPPALAATDTSTSVTSSNNPSVFGQQVDFTAIVTAASPGSGTPTGVVTFSDGVTPLGTGTLIGGQATLATSALAVGDHTITATYNGDPNFNASTTGSLSQVVTFAFSGFFGPVGNAPTVNVVNAGSAVPIQFSLGGNQGLNIFQAGSPSLQLSSCTGGPGTTVLTMTAGNSGFAYDPTTNNYTYTLKTIKAWAGQCATLSVSLIDGTTHTATFQFK